MLLYIASKYLYTPLIKNENNKMAEKEGQRGLNSEDEFEEDEVDADKIFEDLDSMEE